MGDDLDPTLNDPVTVWHPELERHDRVSRGAANAMLASGWEIVPDLPVEPPAVPYDADPAAEVRLWHPVLERHTTVPAGAARSLTKSGGWVLADTLDDPTPFGHDTDGTLADQTIPLAELASSDADPTPTTPDTED